VADTLDHVCLTGDDLRALAYWAGMRVAMGEKPDDVADEMAMRFEIARAAVLAEEDPS
jgi:hypothetical protein